MILNNPLKTAALLLIFLFLFTPISYSGANFPETDGLAATDRLFSFFDLRNRESFVQVTNVGSVDTTVHVQIFDVGNNCNENNFFDNYTPNDTHVYNIRDIQTNDGNPSGVVLPDDAYGFVAVLDNVESSDLIGNFRIIDTTGYEYRTNSVNANSGSCCWDNQGNDVTFNYNTKGNITLSDVVGIAFDFDGDLNEISAADILDSFIPFDVDILNEDEVIFSCRNVIFACTDQDNPLLEELLEVVGEASVASFEYGINNAIPHSRGGELLCPGNNISDGFVRLNVIGSIGSSNMVGFIGLNTGNGRGSMDSFWYVNPDAFPPPTPSPPS